jgi:hypothetical protein
MLQTTLLLGLSGLLAILTFAATFRRVASRLSPKQATHLGDAWTAEAPGLIGLLLPRRPRAIWNLIVFVGAMLLLSIPHWLTVRTVSMRTDWRDYLWYAVTLPWWLALVALTAFVWANHRLAVAQEAAGR